MRTSARQVGINCSYLMVRRRPILRGSGLEATQLSWGTGPTSLILRCPVFEDQEQELCFV